MHPSGEGSSGGISQQSVQYQPYEFYVDKSGSTFTMELPYVIEVPSGEAHQIANQLTAPHSHIANSIGRPVALSARDIVV